jgi:hypothetical protein
MRKWAKFWRAYIVLAVLWLGLWAIVVRSQGVVTPTTTLTLTVHWADSAKASGTVTLTGNGSTQTATDANNGIYTMPAPLVNNVAYTVLWQSSNDPNAAYSFPFIVCCGVDVTSLPSAELDLIFSRSTDAGGFRWRSKTLKVTQVAP